MSRKKGSSQNRRTFLKGIGSAVGVATGVTTVASTADNTVAQETEDTAVTLIVRDQSSSGDVIRIKSLYTESSATLLVFKTEGVQTMYKQVELERGTRYDGKLIQLDTEIPTTQRVTVSVLPEGDASRVETTVTITVDGSGNDPVKQIELVDADSEAGFHYPYFLYRPSTVPETERPLFVKGNNSPSPKDRYEVHKQHARDGLERVRNRFADPFTAPALVPAFPRFREEPVRWDVYAQTLNPKSLQTDFEKLARPDEQLIAMVEHASERLTEEGFTIADQINLYGFSASATFANRFTILHPERVNAVATGGNGVTTLPRTELDGRTLLYPAGVADLPELVGKEFNADAWKRVNQYIFVGREDQPLPEDDGRRYKGFYNLSDERQQLMLDVFGENRVTERFPVTRSVYTNAGANAKFQIYDGVGHRVTREIVQDIRDFHRTHMSVQDVKFDLSAQISSTEIPAGETVRIPVTVESRITEAQTATVTLAVDEEPIETREINVTAGETTSLEFTPTLTDPGARSITVNGETIGNVTVVPAEANEETDAPTSGETATTQPGFGVLHAVGAAAAGTTGYLITQRGSVASDQSTPDFE